ncbi:MAG: C-GCAxxG-C-C family protein [Candidatus Bathyarchaeia archaeon]
MKPQIMSFSFPEKAAIHFKRGYNCAQSVLLSMQEYHNCPNELIPKIATAFGGGIGRCGSLCGALTGAIMAIGMKHGTNEPTPEKRMKAYTLGQKFYQEFLKKFGTPFCRELVGYDLNDPLELEKAYKANVFDEKCSQYVRKAVEILVALET